MDGLLILDKPVGPTSHDVVARARRALGERRIGHTGTLDPEASGVLPLVIGRATRLARFLSAADKSYEAVVRLGRSTNTYDAAGRSTGAPYDGPLPSRDTIDAALDAYRGSFMQQPPAYSAKKIGGQASYKLARLADRRKDGIGREAPTGEPAASPLAAVRVTVSSLEIVGVEGDCVILRVECSAGFYVRSLAHDLGATLGIGAHLLALRRTRSGDATLADAIALEAIEDGERGREQAVAALIPLSRMLPALPALALTDEGVRHAGHGRDLAPGDFAQRASAAVLDAAPPLPPLLRLMDPHGNLVGLAERAGAPGLLHPFVVLM